MPTFVGNMVRVAWKMISGAWKGGDESLGVVTSDRTDLTCDQTDITCDQT